MPDTEVDGDTPIDPVVKVDGMVSNFTPDPLNIAKSEQDSKEINPD